VAVLLFIGAASAVLALWFDHQSGQVDWTSPRTWSGTIGVGATPAAVFLWVFEKWAWKWPPVARLLMTVPNIEGTWSGKECSETFSGGQRDVLVTIRQSPSQIKYTADNGPTINHGAVATLEASDDEDLYRLLVIYRNERTGRPAGKHM